MTGTNNWQFGDPGYRVELDYDMLGPAFHNIVLSIPSGTLSRFSDKSEIEKFLHRVAVVARLIGPDDSLVIEPPYVFKPLPKDGLYSLIADGPGDSKVVVVTNKRLLEVLTEPRGYIDITRVYLTDKEFNKTVSLAPMLERGRPDHAR